MDLKNKRAQAPAMLVVLGFSISVRGAGDSESRSAARGVQNQLANNTCERDS